MLTYDSANYGPDNNDDKEDNEEDEEDNNMNADEIRRPDFFVLMMSCRW
jgi:hypothetical protein